MPPPSNTAPNCASENERIIDEQDRATAIDQLRANLTSVIDPRGNIALFNVYDTTLGSPTFDRVIRQRYGELWTVGWPEVRYDYFEGASSSVPPAVVEGLQQPPTNGLNLSIGESSCSDAWGRHFGKTHLDLDPSIQGDRYAFDEDMKRVCRWTKFTDRLGLATWYGLNFQGQSIVEARQKAAGSATYFRTLRSFSADGQVSARREPDARVFRFSYDAANPSPASRGNLREIVETSANQVDARFWELAYEPLFNQVVKSTDARGYATRYYYDYMEGREAVLAPYILYYLARFGSKATSLGQVANEFQFTELELNSDFRTDRIFGDLIHMARPTAILPDGQAQPYSVSYRRNEFGQVIRIEEPDGHWTDYRYYSSVDPDGDGSIDEFTTVYAEQMTGLQQDARRFTGGYLKSIQRRFDQRIGAFEGDDEPPITSLTTSLQYDKFGNISRTDDGHGAVEQRFSDGFGLLRNRTDAEGYLHGYEYDGNQNLLRYDPPSGYSPVRYFYDVEDRLRGTCTELVAGACNRSLSVLIAARPTDPSILLSTTFYDREGRPQIGTDEEGFNHSSTFDARGLPLVVTSGGTMTSHSYDDAGRVLTRSVIGGDTWTTSYDGFGRPRAVTGPGTSLERTFNAEDHVLTEQELLAGGTTTTYSRDARGRAWRVDRKWEVPTGSEPQEGQDPAVPVRSEITFDPFDQVARVLDPVGKTHRFYYDSLGQLVRTKDPVGQEWNRLYAPTLRNYTETRREAGAGGQSVLVEHFDRIGRLVSSTQQGTSETRVVDGLGLVRSITDRAGYMTQLDYDPAGRLFHRTRQLDDGGANLPAEIYGWDRRGAPTADHDAANVTTTRSYDASGRLQTETTGARSRQYSYDAAGRVFEIERESGAVQQLGYANGFLDHVIAFRPSAGGRVQTARIDFGRDARGRTTSASNAVTEPHAYTVTSTFAYDSLDRLLSERVTDGQQLGVSYRRNARGDLTAVRYPDDSLATFEIDAAGRRKTAIFGTSRVETTWNLDRPILTSFDDGQLRHILSLDASLRPTELTVERLDGSAVFHEEQTLDPLSRVRASQRTTGTDSPFTRAAKYAGPGWLATFAEGKVGGVSLPATLSSNAAVLTFEQSVGLSASPMARNNVGSLTSFTPTAPSAFAATYQSSLHRFDTVTIGGTSFPTHYDDQGRVDTHGAMTLAWDGFDRLGSTTRNDSGDVTRYHYDATGRRVSKTTGSSTTRIVWSGLDQLADYTNGTLTRKTLFGPGLDQPQINTTDAGTSYLARDLQGNVVALVSTSGTISETYHYDPNGARTVTSGQGTCDEATATTHNCPSTKANPFGYNSQLHDDESGLLYYKARYLSPVLRSFLSEDPAGAVDSDNRYSYVGEDSVNFTDPAGRLRQSGGIRKRRFDPRAGFGLEEDEVKQICRADPECYMDEVSDELVHGDGLSEFVETAFSGPRAVWLTVANFSDRVVFEGAAPLARTALDGPLRLAAIPARIEAWVCGGEPGCISMNPPLLDAFSRVSLVARGVTAEAEVAEAVLPIARATPPTRSSIVAAMQGLVDDVSATLNANPGAAAEVLSTPEYLAAQKFPSVARMNFGKAVERLVANAAKTHPVVGGAVRHLGGANQPDFVGVVGSVAHGMNFDVTTARQVAAHLSRSGYGPGLNVLTYTRNALLRVFP